MRALITAWALTLIVLAATVGWSARVWAQGTISLSTPVTFAAPPAISAYQPVSLTIRPGPTAQIVIEIAPTTDLTKVLTFEYPRDCGSFGSTLVDGKQVPNPPTCANLDSSAEVNTLITALNTANLSTRSLWRRVLDRIVADFPSRFPGGGTVQ